MEQAIDYLIKIGGSLMGKDQQFTNLIHFIEKEADQSSIVVTTGSKDLSNVIRRYIAEILTCPLSEQTHVDISMRSRDMMAHALSQTSERFVAIDSLSDIPSALEQGKIPVLLQYHLLLSLQPFPIQRGLSTDTSSAYFADLLKAQKFVKLTNVDGIYETLGQGLPYSSIGTDELREKGPTCVDTKLPDILDKTRMRCYVINGKNIANLKEFLQCGAGLFTCINPKNLG